MGHISTISVLVIPEKNKLSDEVKKDFYKNAQIPKNPLWL